MEPQLMEAHCSTANGAPLRSAAARAKASWRRRFAPPKILTSFLQLEKKLAEVIACTNKPRGGKGIGFDQDNFDMATLTLKPRARLTG